MYVVFENEPFLLHFLSLCRILFIPYSIMNEKTATGDQWIHWMSSGCFESNIFLEDLKVWKSWSLEKLKVLFILNVKKTGQNIRKMSCWRYFWQLSNHSATFYTVWKSLKNSHFYNIFHFKNDQKLVKTAKILNLNRFCSLF